MSGPAQPASRWPPSPLLLPGVSLLLSCPAFPVWGPDGIRTDSGPCHLSAEVE